jgi:hypothetical protein
MSSLLLYYFLSACVSVFVLLSMCVSVCLSICFYVYMHVCGSVIIISNFLSIFFFMCSLSLSGPLARAPLCLDSLTTLCLYSLYSVCSHSLHSVFICSLQSVFIRSLHSVLICSLHSFLICSLCLYAPLCLFVLAHYALQYIIIQPVRLHALLP